MAQPSIANLRANKRFAKQEYDRQMVQQHGAAGADYGDAGPPYWNRASWDAFKSQYGHYPFTASELPPSWEGAPDWVFEYMNLRKPPIGFKAPGGY